ncbi:oxidoreductase [Ectobacillus polymachus]|uniref:oxidoreductase n=1 Tax=Ectobacillus polymachus TaxID=1508806 RepID=UPI003A84CACF
MERKVAVVTGTSSGFGLLTALELAKREYDVIATMRNVDARFNLVEEAKRIGVANRIQVHQLDVTSEESMKQFLPALEELQQVHVLVNNAGYAAGGFVEEIPLEEYKRQFETNLFGVIRVTQAVLPFMRKQRYGKIINMSSISGRIGFPGISPYVASKHALEGWSECLRLEVKPFGIEVILIEPGSYKTNIWSSGKHITEASESSPYYDYMSQIESYLDKGESKFGDPKEVAEKIAQIAEQPNVSLRYPIGKGVKAGIFFKQLVSWKQWERLVLQRLHKKM